jgi:hypothetical protein
MSQTFCWRGLSIAGASLLCDALSVQAGLMLFAKS